MNGISRVTHALIACLCLAASSVPTAAAPTSESLADLFSRTGITDVSVSPSGEWVVGVGRNESRWGVIVQRRGDGIKVPVYSSRDRILRVAWIGDDSLFVRHRQDDVHKAMVLRFEWNGHTTVHDQLRITEYGELVDPLPGEDEIVLWSTVEPRRGYSIHRVERGPIGALGSRWKNSGKRTSGELETVAKLRTSVLRWITDRHGVVRVAIALEDRSDPKLAIYHRSGADDWWWSKVWSEDGSGESLEPLGITPDGRRLIVSAYAGRDTRGLYEFDPETKDFAKVLFQRSDVDVGGVVFDYSGTEIVAAVYHEGGDRKLFYLDEFRDAHLRDVDELGLGEDVMVTGSSRNHRFLTLLVRSARNPGSFYFLDQQTGRLTPIGSVNFAVDPQRLAETRALRVARPDDMDLEVFLTLPRSEAPATHPVLVLPHGGPIGVMDDRSFDPLTQLVAGAGIAVLKVNYRGSGGYGKAFEEAGKLQWGRAIEDDVDAAVRTVVDRGLVDPERMCIAGGSYGGFSALVSAIRRPDRYRCVASINGVTDVPLMFQTADFAMTEVGREALIDLVGDPDADYERMVAVSPVYRVDELEAPVLIIHGTRDVRVDPEHAHRLRAMLRLHGRPYEWFEIEGAGHGFDRKEWRRVAWLLRRFLKRHLATDAGGPAAP